MLGVANRDSLRNKMQGVDALSLCLKKDAGVSDKGTVGSLGLVPSCRASDTWMEASRPSTRTFSVKMAEILYGVIVECLCNADYLAMIENAEQAMVWPKPFNNRRPLPLCVSRVACQEYWRCEYPIVKAGRCVLV